MKKLILMTMAITMAILDLIDYAQLYLVAIGIFVVNPTLMGLFDIVAMLAVVLIIMAVISPEIEKIIHSIRFCRLFGGKSPEKQQNHKSPPQNGL